MRRLFIAVILSLIAAFAISAQTPITTNEMTAAAGEAAKKGDYKAANEWYTKVLKLNPGDINILYSRAGTFVMLKKVDPAIKDLDAILATNPQNQGILIAVLYARASYLNMKGGHKKAIEDAETILKINPEYAGAFQARGTAYLGMKKYKESETDLTKAISLNPRDHVNYTVRAAVYEAQGMAAQAQADKLKAEQLQGH
jgi:tetratricopeptide (TPR) repeat protein